MTIGDSARITNTSSAGYVLTDTDQKIIQNAVTRIEAIVKQKGESYWAKIVQQLKNAAKKYPNSTRMAAIVSTTADRVGSSIQSAVQMEATGTTIVSDTSKSKAYTDAESLLNNGSKSFSNLDMNGIKAIVADQTTAKLLQPIMAKLQPEFLAICKVGESGIYNTLSCSTEDAVNYVKYLYLATESVIKYSSNETDRTYASGTIYAFRGTLHDMTPRSHYGEGDTMFFGFYGSDGNFNKVQIMVGWEVPESGNSANEKQVVFYVSPDAPGYGQQHQYKKLDCINLFGCKKGEKIDGTIEN